MNGLTRGFRRLASGAVFVAGLVAATFSTAVAQTAEQDIERIPLPAGRSYPLHSQVPVTRVSVANPAVADVVVIGERDLVINARAAGETDVIIWTGETRRHFRIIVNPPVDRRQISLGIVFAEVRKDALRQFGVSALYRDNNTRLGIGIFRSDNAINPVTRAVTISPESNFFTALTDFGTDDVLALIEAEATRGNARLLARPNLIRRTDRRATSSPAVRFRCRSPSPAGRPDLRHDHVSRVRHPAGLHAGDSERQLITLAVRPEVSSLDFANAVSSRASGSRRCERGASNDVDVRPNQSLIISGLMAEDGRRCGTGSVPHGYPDPRLPVLQHALAVQRVRAAGGRHADDHRSASCASARRAPTPSRHAASGTGGPRGIQDAGTPSDTGPRRFNNWQ